MSAHCEYTPDMVMRRCMRCGKAWSSNASGTVITRLCPICIANYLPKMVF